MSSGKESENLKLFYETDGINRASTTPLSSTSALHESDSDTTLTDYSQDNSIINKSIKSLQKIIDEKSSDDGCHSPILTQYDKQSPQKLRPLKKKAYSEKKVYLKHRARPSIDRAKERKRLQYSSDSSSSSLPARKTIQKRKRAVSMMNYSKSRSDFIKIKKSSDTNGTSSSSFGENDQNYVIKNGFIFLSYQKISEPLRLSSLSNKKRAKRAPDRFGDFIHIPDDK